MKSPNRIFSPIPRATSPCFRNRRPTASVCPSSTSRTACGSSRSCPNVCSCPIDFACRSGTTGRSSIPRHKRWRWSPNSSPNRATSDARSNCRTSANVRIADRRSFSAVFGPTPHIRPIGSGSRIASAFSGEITVSPSGFSMSLASFARNLLNETPTLAVSPPVASRIPAFIRRATFTGSPSSRSVPVRSRNASSTLTGCTTGENASSTANICAEASRIRAPVTFTTIACGHSRFATAIGIALRHPNGRAS